MLGLTGLGVGGMVAITAWFFGEASCGSTDSFGPAAAGGDCARLVAGMAFRVGVAVGLAAVFFALMVAGLFRTAVRIEEDRRTHFAERYERAGGE
jgi:hypothetical protein